MPKRKPGRPSKLETMARLVTESAATTKKRTQPGRTQRRKELALAAAVKELKDALPSSKRMSAAVSKSAQRIHDGEVYGALANGELDPKATPLDVMIEAMRQAYKLGGALMAAPFAEKAAPYVHGKINNIDLKQVPQQGQAMQGSEQSVQEIGLQRFLVDYIDVEDVTPKELPDGTESP